MSVHVEGWVGEKRDSEKFDRHAQIVLNVAREAYQGGAIFSFELSSEFATSDGAKAVVDELLSLGHAVEVHADTGGCILSGSKLHGPRYHCTCVPHSLC